MRLPLRSLLLGFTALASTQAAITLPDLVADHMVVQREREIPVWGQAAPGSTIKIAMAGHTASAQAGPDGAWQVQLPALPAGGPHKLKITGDGEITVNDVLVGDVWLSSGQSNLTFRMVPNSPWSEGVLDYEKEIAAANNPKLRFFSVTPATSHQPEKEAYGLWQPTTPQDARFLSAVSYYVGQELQQSTGIPIGIIVSGRGGTSIKLWLPRESVEKFAELKNGLATADSRLEKSKDTIAPNLPKVAEFRKKYKESILGNGKVPSLPEPYPHYDTAPAALYNAMIAPLARVPITGFIYYQGESDSGDAKNYAKYFKELITTRRALWNLPEAPFVFVQIANYDPARSRNADPAKFGTSWAEQRAAQAAALELPRTGMAVAADVGESTAIHPRDKKTVGYRLALAARHLAYQEDIPFRGPSLQSALKEGSDVVLKFAVEKGTLTAKGDELTAFELAGADGVFQPATASIKGDTVVVQSPAVPAPAKIRYAWANDPKLSLYDSNGLPCPPFEKDLLGH